MYDVGAEVKERHFFYKERKNDKIWWVGFLDEIGRLAISFDKENPYWKKFWGG